MIIEWFLKHIRVPREDLIEVIDGIDTDSDGYVSLGELIAAVRKLRK